MSTIKKTAEEKKLAKAAYDKARRQAKSAGKTPTTKAEVAADRAAVIAERAMIAERAKSTAAQDALKATAGTHGRPAVAAVKPAKEPKAAKETKVRQPTVATVARKLIAVGSTDEAVFAQLVKQFQVTDAKKSYPSWYRSQMVRKGDITKDFADAHRHNAKV